MRRTILSILGVMMILSLAACTPTSEKNKTGESKQTEAESVPKDTDGPGVVTDRPVDPNEPELEIISIYTVDQEGKMETTMDGVEELSPQILVDRLIEYGVLKEGTKMVNYTEDGETYNKDAGPGVPEEDGSGSIKREYGRLELSDVPEEQKELRLQAVANTFIENMDVVYMTIQVNGQTVGENLSFADVGQ